MYPPARKVIAFSFVFCLLVSPSFGQEMMTDSARWEGALSGAKENYSQGNYPQALKVALPVYQEAVAKGERATVANASNVIGLVDLAQGKPKEALVYFRKALQLNGMIGNKRRVAANLLNIALAQADLKFPDSAIIYLKRSIRSSLALNAKNLVAMGRNHLGHIYLRQGKLASAELEFRSVLADKGYQSDWENSFASTGMAKLCFAKKDYARAATYADRAYTLALSADAKWDAARAMELAHRAYREMGDMPRAYERLMVYQKYSDSLFNADREKELNGMRLRAKLVEN